jgi:hypothetical protein
LGDDRDEWKKAKILISRDQRSHPSLRGLDDFPGIPGQAKKFNGVPGRRRAVHQVIIKGNFPFLDFLLKMIIDKARSDKLGDFQVMSGSEGTPVPLFQIEEDFHGGRNPFGRIGTAKELIEKAKTSSRIRFGLHKPEKRLDFVEVITFPLDEIVFPSDEG